MERIRAAEAEVRSLQAQAEKDGERELAAARRRATDLLHEAETEGIAQAKEILATARAAAAKLRADVLAKGDAEVSTKRAAAEARLDQAVDEILKVFRERVDSTGAATGAGTGGKTAL